MNNRVQDSHSYLALLNTKLKTHTWSRSFIFSFENFWGFTTSWHLRILLHYKNVDMYLSCTNSMFFYWYLCIFLIMVLFWSFTRFHLHERSTKKPTQHANHHGNVASFMQFLDAVHLFIQDGGQCGLVYITTNRC